MTDGKTEIEVDLEEDLLANLAILSIERDEPVNKIINDLIKEFLDAHESNTEEVDSSS